MPDLTEPLKALTPRQEMILAVIRDNLDRRGYPPTMREIGTAVGLNSTSSVAHQLQRLEQLGYLRRGNNQSSRALTIVRNTPTITPGAAAHVLYEYGHRGREAASFTRALIEAIARADHTNRTVLARSYPAYVAAVNTIEQQADGVEQLQRIAGYPVAADLQEVTVGA